MASLVLEILTRLLSFLAGEFRKRRRWLDLREGIHVGIAILEAQGLKIHNTRSSTAVDDVDGSGLSSLLIIVTFAFCRSRMHAASKSEPHGIRPIIHQALHCLFYLCDIIFAYCISIIIIIHCAIHSLPTPPPPPLLPDINNIDCFDPSNTSIKQYT